MRFFIAVTLGVLLAQPLAAQESRDTIRVQRGQPRARIMINGEDMTEQFLPLMQRRARLGVRVSLDAKETDSLGAFIESVTPGGPAHKAGLRSGDIITKLDGKSVLATPGRKVSRGESAPGVQLIELAAKLEPNDTVQVEYLRGDSRRTATVVTSEEASLGLEGGRFIFPEGRVFERIPPGVRIEPMEPQALERVRRLAVVTAFGGALQDLELAPLNPDLGSYFGTTEGVLVIRAPKGSGLGLKGGDVVLSVDGRKPQSASSLLRILRSYDEDETVKLEIMRQKQRQTVTGKLSN
jgi:S1-C subfamily serine protease